MAGKERGPCSVFPRGTSGQSPPRKKAGRGLLAPSHAGTRLPIAAWRPGRRALPLRPLPAGPGRRFLSRCTPFHPKNKKGSGRRNVRRIRLGRHPCGGIIRVRSKGRNRRFLSAHGSPVFCRYYGTGREICQEPCKAAEMGVQSKGQRGVRWRGLRGGCKAPTLKPDLGHANVGKMMGAYSRTAVFRRVRVFCFGQGQKEESV